LLTKIRYQEIESGENSKHFYTGEWQESEYGGERTQRVKTTTTTKKGKLPSTYSNHKSCGTAQPSRFARLC